MRALGALRFFSFERFFKCCSAGGVGGISEVIHIKSKPKTAVYSLFASLYDTMRKGCGTRHVVTSIHALGDHAQNAYRAFASLDNILHKDVEQGKLSQASMPLATMSRTLVFAALLFLYGLRVADAGLTHSISKTETQCNK